MKKKLPVEGEGRRARGGTQLGHAPGQLWGSQRTWGGTSGRGRRQLAVGDSGGGGRGKRPVRGGKEERRKREEARERESKKIYLIFFIRPNF